MHLSSQTISNSFKLLSSGLVDLIYPPLCLNCETRLDGKEEQLCNACLDKFNLLNKTHKQFSVPGEIYLNQAWALFDFDEAFQKLIHQLKYLRRRKPVQRVLDHFEQQILVQLPQKTYDWVISIPLHPRKRRERGYNQVDDVSRWLAAHLGTELGSHLVSRSKYTKSQTQLNAAERLENVRQAFSIMDASAISNKTILLVDDVLTTGATANALAQEICLAGAFRVDLVTLATPQTRKA